jgi:hypothetical protein
MRISLLFSQDVKAMAAAGLVLCLVSACKPAAPPAGPAKPAVAKPTAVVSTTNKAAIEYVSYFEELMPPKGRDPFFPNSHRRDPVPVVMNRPDRPPPPASLLVLSGIVGASNHRLAIINGAILEVGETDSVSVSGGHVKVKCLEIGEDYAVVRAEGEAQPKRLEISKKGF